MYLSKEVLSSIRAEQYNKGYNDAKAANTVNKEQQLINRERDLDIKVNALRGACLLIKAVHEQLRIAGIADWLNQR